MYTVVPSEMYADSTLDTLLESLADDLERLCTEGLEVLCLLYIRAALLLMSDLESRVSLMVPLAS